MQKNKIFAMNLSKRAFYFSLLANLQLKKREMLPSSDVWVHCSLHLSKFTGNTKPFWKRYSYWYIGLSNIQTSTFYFWE